MNLRVVYCNHETAGLEIRERLAFSSEERLRLAYMDLRVRFPKTEIVIVSTCNRVELYFGAEDRGQLPEQESIARFLSEFHEVPLDDFINELRSDTEISAVRHLFLVASSLDSMVLGEAQIVNQIKQSYQRAADYDAVGPITHHLFQAAMKFASQVRTETKLSEGRISIASVAVGEFGKSIFERFSDKTVLVLGAGEMAEETLRYLKEEGVEKIVIANRNLQRGEDLAGRWGGIAIPFMEWESRLSEFDVIVSATGATEPIINKQRFAELRSQPDCQQTLFILDLGAPRDFAPEIARTDDNVFLYDISDLEQTCQQNRKARAREVKKAELLLDEATNHFMHAFYHRATGPVVQQLRETWHAIGKEELDRLYKKMEHVSEEDKQQIEQTISRIVNKLLHPPLENIKHHSREGTPHTLLETVKQLFGLSD
ncbi:glutamyl-tRNA reductase [Rubinisphaera sp.]|uniref:glutamyl-tRNA reductase n=1 Tax=Rubinisphaera sp. TaxID=2024857 RepID=UPI000C0ED2A1|nr:glutamyl-tRNA reductase [Rubinisphaera sp.]MBV07716.1 glutamyl-tRNA reductase [Rubinisphaera sp.]